MIDTDFAPGDDGTWKTSTTAHTNTHIDHGTLTISVADGSSQVGQPRENSSWGDGEVLAVFSLEGAGRAGVMGRFTDTPGQGRSMYAYWITSSGTFGCSKWVHGQSTLLFDERSAAIKAKGDNTLVLRVEGNLLTVWINGQTVKTFTDTQPLPAGGWGAFVQSEQGNGIVQAHFSHITLYKRNA